MRLPPSSPNSDLRRARRDGTPATSSQMAHDVAVFLAWASEPEHDDRCARSSLALAPPRARN